MPLNKETRNKPQTYPKTQIEDKTSLTFFGIGSFTEVDIKFTETHTPATSLALHSPHLNPIEHIWDMLQTS